MQINKETHEEFKLITCRIDQLESTADQTTNTNHMGGHTCPTSTYLHRVFRGAECGRFLGDPESRATTVTQPCSWLSPSICDALSMIVACNFTAEFSKVMRVLELGDAAKACAVTVLPQVWAATLFIADRQFVVPSADMADPTKVQQPM